MQFPNKLAEFVAYRTYLRWVPEKMRRETYEEMVDRVVSYYQEVVPSALISPAEVEEIRDALLNFEVMPSMRLAWTAGEPARKSSIGAYNCSYLPIDSIDAFAEVMYLLMHGTGVGFSTEENIIDQLPVVAHKPTATWNNPPNISNEDIVILEDSKEGWAEGLRQALHAAWRGHVVQLDVSKIRPEGAPLNTFGGRASGPQPLLKATLFCLDVIDGAQGRRLTSLEAHDMVCAIAECIVVGGVRRSALISLSDLKNRQMANAKLGQFWVDNPQRALANNSAVYDERPEPETFWREWTTLVASGSGERGIYNRGAALKKAPGRRKLEGINKQQLGTNPCAEISLRPREFCNLTSVVVRATDTEADLHRKVRIASKMGTIQSTLTQFGWLDTISKDWQKNAEEERLLGVSLTGVMDHKTLHKDPALLDRLRQTAVETNREFAHQLGIEPAAAVTTIKPEGTSSSVNNSAPGFHSRFSPYYLRHVRINATDPLYRMLRDQGMKFVPEVGQDHLEPDQVKTWVCAFPVAAPKGATTINDLTAISQLEIWKTLNTYWAEHSVSATISVGQDEWADVGSWVYENFDQITGLSFLPRTDHVYQLAPYVPISKEEYLKAVEAFPEIDYSMLSRYEYEDHNNGQQQEWACSGNSCDIL